MLHGKKTKQNRVLFQGETNLLNSILGIAVFWGKVKQAPEFTLHLKTVGYDNLTPG